MLHSGLVSCGLITIVFRIWETEPTMFIRQQGVKNTVLHTQQSTTGLGSSSSSIPIMSMGLSILLYFFLSELLSLKQGTVRGLVDLPPDLEIADSQPDLQTPGSQPLHHQSDSWGLALLCHGSQEWQPLRRCDRVVVVE